MAKTKISTSNFLYFLSESGFSNCSTNEETPINHALVEGGIVNTPAFNWGESMDEIEAIFPLPEGRFASMDGDEIELDCAKGKLALPPRKCYNCQKEIGYGDFWITNHNIMSNEILEKMWKSPYVELFCCTCFRKGVYLDKIIKKRERLLNKAYRINEKFGFLE